LSIVFFIVSLRRSVFRFYQAPRARALLEIAWRFLETRAGAEGETRGRGGRHMRNILPFVGLVAASLAGAAPQARAQQTEVSVGVSSFIYDGRPEAFGLSASGASNPDGAVAITGEAALHTAGGAGALLFGVGPRIRLGKGPVVPYVQLHGIGLAAVSTDGGGVAFGAAPGYGVNFALGTDRALQLQAEWPIWTSWGSLNTPRVTASFVFRR
jgi:hypothetical protein